MRIAPGTPIRVSFDFGVGQRVKVGRLLLDGGRGVLEYAAEFISSPLRLNPRYRPSTSLHLAEEPREFDGLHGVLADSLPDSWGALLVRRRAEANRIPYSSLTALDKLAIVGSRGMGALVYEPEIGSEAVAAIDLDTFADAAANLEQGLASDVLSEMERLGGSSGGARPKVLVAINDAGVMIPGDATLPAGFDAWLVKFRSTRHDFEDIGPLEAAYADMARDAGLAISETRLIPAKGVGPGYFATKRFDRPGNNARLHVASVAGIMNTAWHTPTMDYAELLRLVRGVTRQQSAVEEMYGRMAFNVFAHNRDDHTKQHAFIMAADGVWSLAPPYDLTYSAGPGNEHYLAVKGRGGDDITREVLIEVGETNGIARERCGSILDEVSTAVGQFRKYATHYGVGSSTTREVSSVIEADLRRLGSVAARR